MKQSEKLRLTKLTRDVIGSFHSVHPEIKVRAEKCAAKYSPTNAEKFKELAEIVWWLIATDAKADAMRLLDALCEVDDEYYWMFHALASLFATRAWLHATQDDLLASQNDAKTALIWVQRDPNPKPITETEVAQAIQRYDGWLNCVDNEKGAATAVQAISHALRVLVMYQQFANAGCLAAKSVPSQEFTTRIDSGISKLRQRIESW